jgi:hypothetical protein
MMAINVNPTASLVRGPHLGELEAGPALLILTPEIFAVLDRTAQSLPKQYQW